jgi:hypothetical protein
MGLTLLRHERPLGPATMTKGRPDEAEGPGVADRSSALQNYAPPRARTMFWYTLGTLLGEKSGSVTSERPERL